MKKYSFLVNVNGKEEREKFYSYVHNRFDLQDTFGDKELMINSKYPFLINLKDKTIRILGSITCLAVASQSNQILSELSFKQKIKKL